MTPGKAQVGNYTLLKSYWGHVEDLTGVNPTYSTAIPDGASDLGGQVCRSTPNHLCRICTTQICCVDGLSHTCMTMP